MNNCDLEEVKHVALQKFYELVEDPNNYKRTYKNDIKGQDAYGITFVIKVGNFSLEKGHSGYGYGRRYCLVLAGESLFFEYSPAYPHKYRDYLFGSKYENTNYESELAVYKEKLAEFVSKPEVVAINKVFDYFDKIDCEKRQQVLLEAARKSCLKIQEALENPDKIVEIEKSNKEGFWRKLTRYLHS